MRGQAAGIGAAADREFHDARLTRRRWLGAGAWTLLTGMASALEAQSTKKKAPLSPDEERVAGAVRDQAKKSGLGNFEVRWTEHFLGIGDAPAGYSAEALELCESYAKEFLEHFRRLGFRLDYPAHRMTVVSLKDAATFQAFIEERAASAGGQYDPDSNRLVIFDMRPEQADLKAKGSDAERVNTFTLVHETAHMLCYNTGLLPAGRDIPVVIDEGLATYCEYWTPHRGPSTFGRMNEPRLGDLDKILDNGGSWIPIETLLRDDAIFSDPKTEHLAYAESWFLMRYLIRQPAMLVKLKTYLARLPKDKAQREAHATSIFGPLEKLDQETRGYARQVSREYARQVSKRRR
jgi:Protein of unknown function (DUF1570)